MHTVPEPSGPLTHGFVLIEPATLIHTPALAALEMRPCTPRVLAHREELMPRLIDVASLDEHAQAAVTDVWLEELHTARPPVACAWIDSEDGIDALAEHIARYLVGPGADGNPTFWRYYDPRVLALTLAIFDAGQRKALPGPIETWQFAWAGHRWAVSGPDSSAEPADNRVPAWPRPEQWPRVNRSDITVPVLDRLPHRTGAEAATLPAELDRLFSSGIRQGLTHSEDLADYAWHGLTYGAAFEQHPKLIDAWPALADRKVTWPEVVARFTSADFRQLEPSSRSPKA